MLICNSYDITFQDFHTYKKLKIENKINYLAAQKYDKYHRIILLF